MSDKFVDKKENNLTQVDFKVKKKLEFPEEFISRSEVHSILSKNFGKISDSWYKFVMNWNTNAYQTFNDMDKYFILIYLVQKSFRHYSDVFLVYSENDFYAKPYFEIEKINLIEISESLNIAKETVRRKINEMSEDSVISRKGKKIIITMKAFQSQRPRHSIRQLSIFLSNASKYLATEDWFGPPQKASDLENFMRKNFTLVWRFFFRFQIPYLKRQRDYHNDLETFVVAFVVFGNHITRLKEHFIHKPITIENNFDDFGENSYQQWVKVLMLSKEKITGVNASSISEITGIPRATVIRKLRQIVKKEIVYKDQNQLYTLGQHYKKNIKDLEKLFIQNQIDLCKFVATFFELFKNESLKN